MMHSCFIKIFFLHVSRKQVSTNSNVSSVMQHVEQVVVSHLWIMETMEIQCKERRQLSFNAISEAEGCSLNAALKACIIRKH